MSRPLQHILLSILFVALAWFTTSLVAVDAGKSKPSKMASVKAAPVKVPPVLRTPLVDTEAFTFFASTIEPMLTKEIAGDSCVSCHDQDGTSQLIFNGDAENDFTALLSGGYLYTEGPDTFLARVTTTNPKKKMPKGKHAVPWTEEERGKLIAFLDKLDEVVRIKGHADEFFPSALAAPYTGELPKSLDNQFITYRQLKGKVKTQFQDDWVRRGKDLFEENVALFGGADFKTRFNESSKASASFLSGLELMSRDVADRAYTLRTGPFEGRSESLPDPAKTPKADAAYTAEIKRLYNKVLFRDPTSAETKQSFELIRAVYQAKSEIVTSDFNLAFELTVQDPVTKLQAQQLITLPVSGETHGIYQELVDESQTAEKGPLASHKLAKTFQFKKGDTGQRFRLSNVNTFGNVSLVGIELVKMGGKAAPAAPAQPKLAAPAPASNKLPPASNSPVVDAKPAQGASPVANPTPATAATPKAAPKVAQAPAAPVSPKPATATAPKPAAKVAQTPAAPTKPASNPTPAGPAPIRLLITTNGVQADGAWKVEGTGEMTSYEDGNVEKGTSNVVIPITVPETGEYQVTVLWKRNGSNASNVLAEVFSQTGNSLAVAPPPARPAKGEALFHYDSSADNVPYIEMPAVFRFGESDMVEINNTGTTGKVTASALRFLPDTAKSLTLGFLIDTPQAEGHEDWALFEVKKFKSYNQVGTQLTDEGRTKNKGKFSLRYKPSLAKDGETAWKPDTFYKVQVNFPGKAGNELQVPLIVHAQASSPIIQISSPARARAESDVTIDASGSYTVQGSALNYTWKQIDGPQVKLEGSGPVQHFKAPRRSLHQAAWTALCCALMRHPDFLFTRPPSVETARNGDEKRRLQLVKLAMDLVARPPTTAEFDAFAKGAKWEELVDGYLNSQEFRDFYFHRIRLYLESQGTASQDEPARLWTYIENHDLPFQQILTADYTVDESMQRQPRPAYHGKTGVLTMKGFIEGKPGLPHFNYAAQVSMLFLGYVFEVPPEVVEQRQGSTAASTVDPAGICYGCHKVLTPLALQRSMWTDDGRFRTHDEYGLPIDASDAHLVDGYPFAGEGLQAFATQAVKKERFIRTIVDTHATFYFGRQLRWKEDERYLYHRVWDNLHKDNYTLRSLIRTLVTSREYIEGKAVPHPLPPPPAITPKVTTVSAPASPSPAKP